MFESLKKWFARQREINIAKSDALHDERMRTIHSEAKIDNELRLAKKKRAAAQIRSMASSIKLKPTIAKKKSKVQSAASNASILDMEF